LEEDIWKVAVSYIMQEDEREREGEREREWVEWTVAFNGIIIITF